MKTKLSRLIDSTDEKINNSINELSLIQSKYLYEKYTHILESEKKRKQKRFEKTFVLSAFALHIGIILSIIIF